MTRALLASAVVMDAAGWACTAQGAYGLARVCFSAALPFLDARGRLGDLMRGDEATMCFVERTVVMNSIDAIDPDIQPVEVGIAAGEWAIYLRKGSRDEVRG